MYPESRRSGPENETPAVGRRRWGAWARTELQWSGNGLAGLRDRAVRSRIWVTWQSAQQRARRGGTVTMSGSDATDGAGSAAAERPQHTPTPRAGQAARQMDLFGHLWGRHHRHDTGLHSCRPALATTADVNSGHFVVQDANSVCPPSRRCRPKPAVGGWCSPTPRPLDVEIPLIVVVMTPRSTRDGLGIGIAGDGDTRGQRHLEWGTNTGVGGGPVTNTRARTDHLKPPRLRWHRPVTAPIRSTTGHGPTRPAPRVGQGGTVRTPPPLSSRRCEASGTFPAGG